VHLFAPRARDRPRPERFSALRIRDYRLFFIGQLVSVSGTWMQTVGQALLVLELTHSGTVLGLVIGVRFAPLLLLSPWAGVVADRQDRRRIMLVTQTCAGLLALSFGVLVSTDSMRLWIVYVLAGLLGVVNAFENPARQTMIGDLVQRQDLPNAVMLNSVLVNVGRTFGAMLGGLAASFIGLAACFYLNSASFVAVIATLLAMSYRPGPDRIRLSREPGQIRAGLRYARHERDILVPLVMIAVVGTLAWEFQVTLPLLATETFHGGSGLYGAMAAAMAAGAVVGGLWSAALRPAPYSLAFAAIGWGVAIIGAALAPNITVVFVILPFVGYGSVVFNAVSKTTLQLAASPAMTGRVMALWVMGWAGLTPVGGPIVGWIAEEFGARWSLLVGGVASLAVGLIALLGVRAHLLRSSRNEDVGPGQVGPATASPADAIRTIEGE
jgi:MFS family permease